jgi:hypothetical protein
MKPKIEIAACLNIGFYSVLSGPAFFVPGCMAEFQVRGNRQFTVMNGDNTIVKLHSRRAI